MKIHTNDLNYLRAHTNTPIFAYCRKLLEEGCTEEFLEIYGPSQSGGEILYSNTNIAKGALLTVDEKSTPRFVLYRGYKG